MQKRAQRGVSDHPKRAPAPGGTAAAHHPTCSTPSNKHHDNQTSSWLRLLPLRNPAMLCAMPHRHTHTITHVGCQTPQSESCKFVLQHRPIKKRANHTKAVTCQATHNKAPKVKEALHAHLAQPRQHHNARHDLIRPKTAATWPCSHICQSGTAVLVRQAGASRRRG